MSKLANGLNAWIFLNEDEPPGSNYNSENSCFQSLIRYKTYKSIDFLGIAFFEVSNGPDGYSIQIGAANHPGGATNQDYLKNILRDAREVNPNIKFLATTVYSGSNTLTSIFSNGGDPKSNSIAFAKNLVKYLKENGMNGLDIDWENQVESMTREQFAILFSAIREEFDSNPVKYYLSFTPADNMGGIDYPTLNTAFDFISPQFYDSKSLSYFISAGMSPAKIGYGAQFEPGNNAPNSSAQQVWDAVCPGFEANGKTYDYQDIFVWRLNSGNFQFEQAQFMILGEIANPSATNNFDDSNIIAAAGNPNITQITIRSGNVLDAIQTSNTGLSSYNKGTQPPGTETGNFSLPQHGGTSGESKTINIPLNDPIVSISGYTGVWFGWNCVLQLTLTTKSGTTFGPFGNMSSASSQSPFKQNGQIGQSLVAFKGSTVTVPLSGGGTTAIIASLTGIFV